VTRAVLARQYDLLGDCAVVRGLPWSLFFTRRQHDRAPIDLTGCAARLEVFDTRRPRAPWVFSTTSGHITLGGDAGTVDIALSGEDTAQIRTTAARYRIVFTDSQQHDAIYLRGRLAVLEPVL
jgi:hypothetical protein